MPNAPKPAETDVLADCSRLFDESLNHFALRMFDERNALAALLLEREQTEKQYRGYPKPGIADEARARLHAIRENDPNEQGGSGDG